MEKEFVDRKLSRSQNNLELWRENEKMLDKKDKEKCKALKLKFCCRTTDEDAVYTAIEHCSFPWLSLCLMLPLATGLCPLSQGS